jgi:hypothetical protein
MLGFIGCKTSKENIICKSEIVSDIEFKSLTDIRATNLVNVSDTTFSFRIFNKLYLAKKSNGEVLDVFKFDKEEHYDYAKINDSLILSLNSLRATGANSLESLFIQNRRNRQIQYFNFENTPGLLKDKEGQVIGYVKSFNKRSDLESSETWEYHLNNTDTSVLVCMSKVLNPIWANVSTDNSEFNQNKQHWIGKVYLNKPPKKFNNIFMEDSIVQCCYPMVFSNWQGTLLKNSDFLIGSFYSTKITRLVKSEDNSIFENYKYKLVNSYIEPLINRKTEYSDLFTYDRFNNLNSDGSKNGFYRIYMKALNTINESNTFLYQPSILLWHTMDGKIFESVLPLGVGRFGSFMEGDFLYVVNAKKSKEKGYLIISKIKVARASYETEEDALKKLNIQLKECYQSQNTSNILKSTKTKDNDIFCLHVEQMCDGCRDLFIRKLSLVSALRSDIKIVFFGDNPKTFLKTKYPLLNQNSNIFTFDSSATKIQYASNTAGVPLFPSKNRDNPMKFDFNNMNQIDSYLFRRELIVE